MIASTSFALNAATKRSSRALISAAASAQAGAPNTMIERLNRIAVAPPFICSTICFPSLDDLLRQGDRDLVEAYRVFEDQLVEGCLAECRLRRGVSHCLGMRPRAVETREVAGPQEIAQADLGHAPKTALLLDLEGEEHLTLDILGRHVGQRDVGLEDAALRAAEIIFPVEAPIEE